MNPDAPRYWLSALALVGTGIAPLHAAEAPVGQEYGSYKQEAVKDLQEGYEVMVRAHGADPAVQELVERSEEHKSEVQSPCKLVGRIVHKEKDNMDFKIV